MDLTTIDATSCPSLKAGDAVTRVLGKTQRRKHVLDVRSFDEFQTAVFHERDIAAGQLHFELIAVPAGPEQHRLTLQRDALLQMRDCQRFSKGHCGGPSGRTAV